METIAHQPFGKALLIAMVVGLACYATWRLVRAGIGHGTQERDSALQRVAGVVSGVAYAALCVTAVKILIGASSGGGSGSPKKTTGGVLDWTGGTTIVAVVGAILIGVARGDPTGKVGSAGDGRGPRRCLSRRSRDHR